MSRRVLALLSLGLVVTLAGALRFSRLGELPAGFFRDEAEKGYNAYALLRSGGIVEFPRDRAAAPETGIRLRRAPILADVAGVTTSLVYQYASIPFLAIGGLGVATTRMAAASAGTLAVALLGLLWLRIESAREGESKVEGEATDATPAPPGSPDREPLPAWSASAIRLLAVLAPAVSLAMCPWHVVFSRWALQGIFVPVGMLGVLWGLFESRRRPWGFPLAGASLAFVFYAYSGAQPFALLWGAALALLYRRELAARPISTAVGAALFLSVALPGLYVTFLAGGGARLDAVAVWNADDATPARVVARVAVAWLRHFDPRFLFVQGDSLPRHCVPGWGQLLVTDVVLAPLGAWTLWRGRHPLRGALAAALLCGPVGAAITHGHIPHALRAIPMAPVFAILSGVGFAPAMEWIASHADRRGVAGGAWRGVRAFALASMLAAWWLVAGFAAHGRYEHVQGASPEERTPSDQLSRVRLRAFGPRLDDSFSDLDMDEYEYQIEQFWHIRSLDAFEATYLPAFEAASRGTLPLRADSIRENAVLRPDDPARARRPPEAGRVWVDGRIPFAAYFAMFAERMDPVALAERGFEAHGWFILPPERLERVGSEYARPGDWFVVLDERGRATSGRLE